MEVRKGFICSMVKGEITLTKCINQNYDEKGPAELEKHGNA